jgi:Flp pilus assembly protein TadG
MRMPRVPARPRRRASAAVEFAVVAPVLFAFMFAIFEYGRYIQMRQIMQNAAREGARVAVVTPTSYVPPATATAQIVAVVNNSLAGQNLQNVNVQVYQADTAGNNIGPWTSAPFGRNIVVQLDADMVNLFPGAGYLPTGGAAPNSTHITVKCMMRGEAN